MSEERAGIQYETVDDSYFEARGLKRYAGVWSLWALGVGAVISGDFFVTPPRVVFDLESALAGVRLDEVEPAIEHFFESSDVDTLSVTPADFKASIANALEQRAAHG